MPCYIGFKWKVDGRIEWKYTNGVNGNYAADADQELNCLRAIARFDRAFFVTPPR